VAAGWVEELVLPSGTATRSFGTPIAIDGVREPIRRPPPALGGDTAAVLASLQEAAAQAVTPLRRTGTMP
jgi:crotonobetainyl-CoA:carnitine CoA-transferase CaiB-like acyl-CoA transferase